MTILQMIELGIQEGAELEALKAEIDAGQPATAPPIHTFIDGRGGNIVVSWQPDGAPSA